MSTSQPTYRTGILAGGILALVLALWIGWYTLRTPTASPGPVPAVPPANRAFVPSPEEGMVVPALSTADAEKIKRGGTVTINVPGGKLEIGPPKKGDQK